MRSSAFITPKRSLSAFSILFSILVVGCTGSTPGQTSSSDPNTDSSAAQRLPADVSASTASGNGVDTVEYRSSDDPNLVLPEPAARTKTESTGAMKSRKPASSH